MSKHKNSNDALGNYGIYEIFVNGKTYKIGKADLDRITKYSGDPVRISQQIRKLQRKYGVNNVFYDFIQRFFGVTTKEAKDFELVVLQFIYAQQGVVPQGNQRSFKP